MVLVLGLDPGFSLQGDALPEQNFLTCQICVIAGLHRCEEEQTRSCIQSAWPVTSTRGILVPSPLAFSSPSERSDMKRGGQGRGGTQAEAKIMRSGWEIYFSSALAWWL